MKTSLLLGVFLYAISSTFSFAQTQTFQEELRETFRHGKGSLIMDAILEKMAAGNQQELSEVELVLSFTKKITLTKKEGQKLYALIEIVPQEVSGATQYKGFEVGNDILPAAVSFQLDKKLEDGKLFTLKSFKRVERNAKGIYVAEHTWTQNIEIKDLKLQVDELHSYYDAVARDTFLEKIATIDSYHEQTEEIHQYHELLANMDFKDPKQLERNNLKIKQLDEHLGNFKEFADKLNLSEDDPLDFNKAYQELQQTHQVFTTAYQEAVRDIHVLYYQEGMRLQREGKETAAVSDFKQALIHQEDYTPPLYQLARIAYLKGRFEEAEAKLDKIWEINPQNVPMQKQASALYEDLYYHHRSNADKHVRELKFEDARKEFEKAKRICGKNILSGSCQAELAERNTKLIQNEFEYSVAEARNQVYSKGFRKANKALKRALELMEKHPKEVGDQGEMLKGTYQELYAVCIEDAKERVESKDFHVAVEGLRFAELLKEQNKELSYEGGDLDAIYAPAFDGNYHKMLNEAAQLQEIKELVAARDILLQAFADETTHKQWIKNPETDRIGAMLNELYRDFIGRANQKYTQKEFEDALEDYRYAYNLSHEFSLIRKDNEIGKGFYQTYMELSKAALEKKDFQTALEYCQIAQVELQDETFAEKETFINEAKTQRETSLNKWVQNRVELAKTAYSESKNNQAKSILKEVKDLLQAHKFDLDKGVKRQYDSLRKKVN